MNDAQARYVKRANGLIPRIVHVRRHHGPDGERKILREIADHYARAAALHDPEGCWYCEQLVATQPEATRDERDDFMHITAPCSASWYVPVPPAFL